ncbi:MAG: hypothetical protein ABH844_02730 [Candidatus Omnitrophota bacterium]
MYREESKIRCPIFVKREEKINTLVDKINKEDEAREKTKFAKELQEAVNVLFSCSKYDSNNFDCKKCHFIAGLRKKTADLIINIGDM